MGEASTNFGALGSTISLIKQSRDFFEKFKFEYTNFDGHLVKIANGKVDVVGDNKLETFYKLHGGLFVIDGKYYQLMS